MTRRTIEDAAAQLSRLLLAIPTLADGKCHSIEVVARKIGTDGDTLVRDLSTIVTRFDSSPAQGFSEDLQLMFGSGTVEMHTPAFHRPMGLARAELRALELGLAMLRRETPLHEQGTLESARSKIRSVAASAAPDAIDAAAGIPVLGATGDAAHLAALRSAIRKHLKASITYHGANDTSPAQRTVHPFGTVFVRGRWFLIAHCDRANAIRVFRVDRITSVSVEPDSPAKVAEPAALEGLLKEGRMFASRAVETLRVSYSPRIARWIAEREQGVEQPDGSFVVEHPLADDEWAVRHVLQYGPEAEVLGPERVRAIVAERVRGIGEGRMR